jgi:hypothetical protein
LMFMDELTKYLAKQLSIKNDEFRNSLPINYITHELVLLKSQKSPSKKWNKKTKYKYDHFNGSLILSRKMLDCDNIHKVLKDVQKYDNFTKDNDPYQERRFGDINYKSLSFEDEIERESLVFWKIEFWDDKSLKHKSTDYLKQKCYRTLTIYNASEV